MDLTQEQREKFKKFVESRVTTQERVYDKYYNQEGRYYRKVSISCPCGKDRLYSSKSECDKEGNFNYWKPIHESSRLLLHIEHQIRMNASKFHIDLLKEIIGEESTIEILERFAKKNMVVALALKKYIEELKRLNKTLEVQHR